MSAIANAFFAAVNLLYAAAFGGPIDGTTWDVTVRKDGFFSFSKRRETLIFHGGRAVIAGELARGYAPPLYEAKQDEGKTDFWIQLADAGRDRVEWSGRVEGDRVAGVVMVRGADGKTLRYVFTGSRRSG